MALSCTHRAETATKIKLERVAEIKRLNAQIMSVRRFVPYIHTYVCTVCSIIMFVSTVCSCVLYVWHCMYVPTCVYIRTVSICVCTYVCTHLYLGVYVYTYIRTFVCTYCIYGLFVPVCE